MWGAGLISWVCQPPGPGEGVGIYSEDFHSFKQAPGTPATVRASGRAGLRRRARPWQKLAGGIPTPGTTGPGKPVAGPYELCPGGSGQLPPQAPGLSGRSEHRSRGTALASGDTKPALLSRNASGFPTSRTRLLVPGPHFTGRGLRIWANRAASH